MKNQNKKLVCEIKTETAGENRLVYLLKKEYADAVFAVPPETSDKNAAGPEAGHDSMETLSHSIGKTIQREIDKTLERHVDPAETPFEELSTVIEEFIDRFSGSWDRLRAVLFGGFHLKKEEIDEAIADATPPEIPAGADVDREIPPPSPTEIKREGETSYRNRKRAEHAENKLNEHPDWRNFIERGVRRWEIPLEVYVIFIEMESGFNPNSHPTYKDKNGKTIRRPRMSHEEARKQRLTLITSAHGLAQAMLHEKKPEKLTGPVVKYVAERYHQFLAENGGLPHLPRNPDLREIMYIPEVAIDFFGWHMRHKINEANTFVRELGLDQDKYHLTTNSDPELLYMIYNQGGLGYALLMRYLENPTQANHDALKRFQKESRVLGGRTIEGWQARKEYAARVGATAKHYAKNPSTIAWANSINAGRGAAIV